MDFFDDADGLLQEQKYSPFKDISNSPPRAQLTKNNILPNLPTTQQIPVVPSLPNPPTTQQIPVVPKYIEQTVTTVADITTNSKPSYSEVPKPAPVCNTEANGNQYDWDTWDD